MQERDIRPMFELRRWLLLLLVSLALGCDPGSCPEDSTVTWADVEPLFSEHCTSCHSSQLTGADRLEAPVGYDYDSLENARAHPNWTWAEILLGHMPPAGALGEQDQQMIREWLACDGPD